MLFQKIQAIFSLCDLPAPKAQGQALRYCFWCAIVRCAPHRQSLPVQLNHIRRSAVGILRATNTAEQSGRDVPLLPAFRDNSNRLFVVTGEHPNQQRPSIRLKRNSIANTELQHLGVSPHVPQEFQPLDNAVLRSINSASVSPSISILMIPQDLIDRLPP